MTNVTYFLRDNGGCGYYRADLPFTTARRRGHIKATRVEKGDSTNYIAQALDKADVILVPRITEGNFISHLGEYQKQGKKVVVDWDDDIFRVSPFSPHYEDFGTENISVEVHGEKISVWEDGRNIDLKANIKKLDGAKKVCSLVDMVTVTTDTLAQVYRQYNDNVVVLPNCLDTTLWKKLPLIKSDSSIRMGWFGGHSHFEDWGVIAGILPELMRKYPELKLVIMGAKFDGTLKDIPKHQIEFHGWTHTQAYHYKAAILDLDFAIIPLKETEFNMCKSPIKWIEMSALKVPSVVSNVLPYSAMSELSEENGIYIDNNDPEAWLAGISLMVENLKLRQFMGDRAYETVVQNFDINNQFHQWVNAYQEVVTCQRRQIPA